jgi:hypothetical protein
VLSLHELFMRPGFGDAAVHEHDYLRVLGYRVVTMRRKNDDLAPGLLRNELKDCALAFRIQTCDRFIQDHQRGILINEACEGQALPLSAGEIDSPSKSCTDQRVDPVR